MLGITGTGARATSSSMSVFAVGTLRWRRMMMMMMLWCEEEEEEEEEEDVMV